MLTFTNRFLENEKGTPVKYTVGSSGGSGESVERAQERE